jgi:hypothetical protein
MEALARAGFSHIVVNSFNHDTSEARCGIDKDHYGNTMPSGILGE